MKILYFLFFVTSLTFAQCDLGNNGMGTFESSADISKWFYSGQGQGTVEEEYSEVHEGNTSMKAVADIFSPWQVRIKTNACSFSINAGQTYLFSIWLKVTDGNQFSVTLEEVSS